ncbi:pentapeptide repeat-containing protein [Streptomyces sp. NPDC020965]|uniref:pentapeptide repeat-containing protein n=1 Tax=Streptomyces sp. NPDC020965 TaxID=3365105 RepID=UPI0037BB0578
MDAHELLGSRRTLSDIDFSDMDLGRLLRADDEPYTFQRCTFDGSDLSGADLRGASFIGCSLNHSVIRRADLERTIWRGGTAPFCDFTDADVTDAEFDGMDLSNTCWRGTLLAATVFTGCRLVGARLQHSRGVGYGFSRCNLMLADLSGLSLRRRELVGLRMTEANLAGVDFTEATFTECQLLGAELRAATFTDADLRGADLGKLSLRECVNLRGAFISVDQASGLLAGLGLRIMDG